MKNKIQDMTFSSIQERQAAFDLIDKELKFSSITTSYLSDLIEFKKQPPEVFCKKGVLRSLPKFTRKHLCQGLFY